MMRNQNVLVFASLIFAFIFGVSTPRRMQTQDNSEPSTMLPLDQYLMDRDAEIAMARSAAPPSIARGATVMVLGRHGYETAADGKNGFVCIVGRSWDLPKNNPAFSGGSIGYTVDNYKRIADVNLDDDSDEDYLGTFSAAPDQRVAT
jgi:hypothetical protein